MSRSSKAVIRVSCLGKTIGGGLVSLKEFADFDFLIV